MTTKYLLRLSMVLILLSCILTTNNAQNTQKKMHPNTK